MVTLYKVDTKEEGGKIALQCLLKVLKDHPEGPIGLPTGSTPLPFYNAIIEAYKNGNIDCRKLKTINMDEYCGILPTNDQSYRYFMNDNLFNKAGFNLANTHVPNSNNDYVKNCYDYDDLIKELAPKGIPLFYGGIGENGHLAFNEPGDKFIRRTHIVELSEDTIKVNSRFFNNISDVPKKAISVGFEPIMHSKMFVLMAFGAQKAEALKDALTGPITTKCPASILQLHENLVIICDYSAGRFII